jgi:hypothetical protein
MRCGRAWANDVQGEALDGGHFFPEEIPQRTAEELSAFFASVSEAWIKMLARTNKRQFRNASIYGPPPHAFISVPQASRSP